MENKCCCLKEQIRAARFALHELRLYLDTHPDDEDAQKEYCARNEKVMAMEKEYAECCGTRPWISDPWPWDYH